MSYVSLRTGLTRKFCSLMQRSKYTEFCHPSLQINNGIHGEGVIATNYIPMGSILLVECGLFNIQKTPTGKDIMDFINKHKQDESIKNVMDTLYYNDNAKRLYDSDDIDVQRFIINSVGGDIFPILSKINHGYPTNIVIFRSPTHSKNMEINNDLRNKAIVVAIDDINKSDELFYDYFNIMNVTNIDNSLEMFKMNKTIHDIDIDKDIYNDFVALDGKYNFINSQTITDKKEYKTMFLRIVNDICLNGICSSGCFVEIDKQRICKRKQEIKEKIFRMEFSMQHSKHGGFFSQIAQTSIDHTKYNAIIESVQSELTLRQLRKLFSIYGFDFM
eukprot:136881_1